MKGLSKRQREILSFIEDFIKAHHFSPSYREILHHFHFSSLASVHKHIQTLKKKGALYHDTLSARSLHIHKNFIKPESGVNLPLIGKLEKGLHLFSHTKVMKIPPHLVTHPENSYLLRIEENGFEEEGIYPNDLLIVTSFHEIHEGNTVLALINKQELLIKKYFYSPPYIEFKGKNPEIRPLLFHEKDVHIQGVLVALLRTF